MMLRANSCDGCHKQAFSTSSGDTEARSALRQGAHAFPELSNLVCRARLRTVAQHATPIAIILTCRRRPLLAANNRSLAIEDSSPLHKGTGKKWRPMRSALTAHNDLERL